MELKIPDIAAGKVVPFSVTKEMMEQEKQKKRDNISVCALVISILSLLVSVVAIFMSR